MPEVGRQIDAVRWLRSATPGDYQPSMHALCAMPGVIVRDAACRNGRGTGHLRFRRTAAGAAFLSYKAPGSSVYGNVLFPNNDLDIVMVDGADANKWLRISIDVSELPAGERVEKVYLDLRHGTVAAPLLGSDGGSPDSDSGTAYLQNISALPIANVRAWLQPFSLYTIRKQAPDAYVAPTTEAAAIQIADSVAPGAVFSMQWIRTIPGGVVVGSYFQEGVINVRWDSLE